MHMLDTMLLRTCIGAAAERLQRIRLAAVCIFDLAVARDSSLSHEERNELAHRLRSVSAHSGQALKLLDEALDHLDIEAPPSTRRGHAGHR